MPGSGTLNPLLAANKVAAAKPAAGRGTQGVANTGTNVAQQNAAATAGGVRGRGAGVGTATPTAPPKANAAPSVNKNIAVGLITALNNAEEELVKKGVWEVANRYSIEFAPAELGDARVTKGGKPNKAKVPMQQSKNPSDKVNPDSNSADYDVRTFQITAGQPIVVVLDEIIKNSTYIADQASYIIDETTQKSKPQKPLGDLVWYKISVQTTPIKFDKKRNDYAYNITYVISAYPINSMQSEYFPTTKLRGRHKSYKYWFTGQNTQVLKFEQSFNKLYYTTFTNPETLTATRIENNRETPPREYQAAVSGSSSQGAEGRTNSIGASAADYLYNRSDIANCQLTIVGDPAWIQQGEAATGISSVNFNFNPFNPDGGINFDAQQIIFDLQWNPGVDYDLTGTGLANPNTSGTPSAVYTYLATEVVSRFSKGKFEQDLKGVFIDLLDPSSASAAANKENNTQRAESASQADVRRVGNATAAAENNNGPTAQSADVRKLDNTIAEADANAALADAVAANQATNDEDSPTEEIVLDAIANDDIEAYAKLSQPPTDPYGVLAAEDAAIAEENAALFPDEIIAGESDAVYESPVNQIMSREA
jgi:hypothetical protein